MYYNEFNETSEWVEYSTVDGIPYYYNITSQTVQWEPPFQNHSSDNINYSPGPGLGLGLKESIDSDDKSNEPFALINQYENENNVDINNQEQDTTRFPYQNKVPGDSQDQDSNHIEHKSPKSKSMKTTVVRAGMKYF
jgi:hypothetical protein